MAYDAARERVVVFGGRAGPVVPPTRLADTWEWDGKTWFQIKTPVAPPAREGHAMVYDEARQRVVLFGGSTIGRYLSDTWEWDGKVWRQLKPKTSPYDRYSHGMAYDSIRQRVVLFGGFISIGQGWDGETWEWDGKDWTRIKVTGSRPSPRTGASLIYDSARRITVLFGGHDGIGSRYDTWLWDGKNWTKAIPKAPSVRDGAMAYDSARQRAVLYGPTHEWDGKNWNSVTSTSNPGVLSDHRLVYDSVRQRVVLFGGRKSFSAMAETWEYSVSGVVASFVPYGKSCGPILDPKAGQRPLLGKPYTLETLGFAPTASMGWMMVSSSRWSYGPILLPVALDPFGLKGCSLHAGLDVLLALPLRNGAGSVSIQIPATTRLLGARAAFQAMAGRLTSNGGEVLLGNR